MSPAQIDHAVVRDTALRVLHVITGLNDGGAEAVLHRLVMHDRTDTHHVISLSGDGKYGPLLRAAGIQLTSLNMPRGHVTRSGLRKLWRVVRTWRPDIVQTWMYHANLLGGLAGHLRGVPVVWGIRHSTLDPVHSSRGTVWVSRVCAWLSRWVPSRIVCCADASKEVHAALGYDAARMVVIPNGYDLTRFAPDEGARVRLRTEWAVRARCPMLGMVGRFDLQKDHGNLVAALGMLKAAGVAFDVVLVGSGMDASNNMLCSAVAGAGIAAQVRLLGQRTDIPAVMNALDVHVLSSAYGEAFPNVLAEAMACGTPCVTTDVGDATLIVADTGWSVPARDPATLASCLADALREWEEPAVWRERQRRARQRIVNEFGIEKMVERYRAVWRDAAGRSTGRAVPC